MNEQTSNSNRILTVAEVIDAPRRRLISNAGGLTLSAVAVALVSGRRVWR